VIIVEKNAVAVLGFTSLIKKRVIQLINVDAITVKIIGLTCGSVIKRIVRNNVSEAVDYYRTPRGYSPNSQNKRSLQALIKLWLMMLFIYQIKCLGSSKAIFISELL
jgi:hypothetical protein